MSGPIELAPSPSAGQPSRHTFTFAQAGGLKVAALTLAMAIAMTVLTACGGDKERHASPELATRLQHVLDRAVDSPKTVFPGTALYVSQPELGTWAGAAGEGNIDPSAPMKAEDTFRAGSIMKPFVAAAVLQLAEGGEFALDDRLPAVLPQDVVARIAEADRITVRMLLNHTSGIPEYSDKQHERMVFIDPHRIWDVDEFLEMAAAHPRPFEPGEGYAYSNTDYNLLGLVIEEATGESWREVVRERVIDRLDLEHTSLPEPGDASIGSGAHGYQLLDGELRDFTDIDPSMAGAAGGHALITTTEDLARFLDAVLAGELFDQAATLEEMLTFVEATDENPFLVGYGLGLERWELPGGLEMIGHLGTTAGYRAFVGRVPARDVDIAMIITAPDDPTPVLVPALELMLGQAS